MVEREQRLPPWYGRHLPPQSQHLEARQLEPLISAVSSVIMSLVSPATTTDVVDPVDTTTAIPAAETTPLIPAVPPAATTTAGVISEAPLVTTPVPVPVPVSTTPIPVAETSTTPVVVPIPTTPAQQSTVVVETTATAPVPTSAASVATIITSIPKETSTTATTPTTTIPTLTPIVTSATSSASASTTAIANSNKGSSHSGLSKSATIGVAVGVSLGVVALALLGFLLICCLRRRRDRNDPFKQNNGSDNESFLDGGGPSGMRETSGHHGGMGAIEALGAGAAAVGAVGAAEGIARRSRHQDGYGAPFIPPPHQLSGNRRSSGDYAYGSGDPFEDGNRPMNNGMRDSSRHSLPLAAVSENPDEIEPTGGLQRRSLTDQGGAILLMPGPRPGGPGDRRSGGPPPAMMTGRPRRGRPPSYGNGRRPYGPGMRGPPPQYYDNGYDNGYGPGPSYGPGPGPRGPPMQTRNLSSSPPDEGMMQQGRPSNSPRRLSQGAPTSPGGSAAAVKRKPVSGGSPGAITGNDERGSFDFGLDGVGGGPGPVHQDEAPRFWPSQL